MMLFKEQLIVLESAAKNQNILSLVSGDYGLCIERKNRSFVSKIREAARVLKDNCKHRITTKGILEDGQWKMEVFVPADGEVGIEAVISFTTKFKDISYITVNLQKKFLSEIAY